MNSNPINSLFRALDTKDNTRRNASLNEAFDSLYPNLEETPKKAKKDLEALENTLSKLHATRTRHIKDDYKEIFSIPDTNLIDQMYEGDMTNFLVYFSEAIKKFTGIVIKSQNPIVDKSENGKKSFSVDGYSFEQRIHQGETENPIYAMSTPYNTKLKLESKMSGAMNKVTLLENNEITKSIAYEM